ncbi:MAG: hypothetical protein L6461_08000 [Anaerolineae bacterium]|nr:hypothetical protein [Anaerolineae bacterium]
MKFNWKWAVGIALLFILLAGLVAIPFAMHSYAFAQGGMPQSGRAFDAPDGWTHPGMMSQRDGRSFDRFHSGPMMGSRGGFGFSPFLGGFMLVGGLFRLFVPLAILFGIVYFSYQQGKKAGLKAVQAAPVTAAAPDETQAS